MSSVRRLLNRNANSFRYSGRYFFADLVVGAHHAAFEQRPEIIDMCGVDVTAHVLTRTVSDKLMRECRSQVPIAIGFIGRDQINFIADHFAHEAIQRRLVSVLDHLADDVSLAGDRADHGNLIDGALGVRALLAPMLVFEFAAHVSFVHFDNAHKLPELRIGQSGAKPMANEPRRPIGACSDHPMDLKCANSLLAGQHQVENLEPDQQLVIRVLENRVDRNREPIRGARSLPAFRALPVEGPRLAGVNVLVSATRASNALRPTLIAEIRFAGILIGEHSVESRKGQLFNELRSMFVLIVLKHEPNIAHSTMIVKRCIIAFAKLAATGVGRAFGAEAAAKQKACPTRAPP